MQQTDKNNENSNTPTNLSTFSHLPDSELYVNKLENKLSKIKGSEKNLTSKNMLSVLRQAKDDILNRLITNLETIAADDIEFEADKEVSVSFLEKKIFPEMNGVTQEEMQHLLESDVLAKITAERNNSTHSNESIER